MKNKAFTLIELLAVIIILGVLMLIAIPSVTSYINNSRKETYASTVQELIKAASTKVNSGELEMYDTDTTYYIPVGALELENGKATSPYGEFEEAYVAVNYNGEEYDYYFVGRDSTGMGIKKATIVDEISKDSIISNINSSSIRNDVGIDGRSKVMVLTQDGRTTPSTNAKIPFEVVSGDINNLKIGDELCLETECFNVVGFDGDDVKLLTKYNLYVGIIDDYKNNVVTQISENDNKFLLQNNEAIGYTDTEHLFFNAVVPFSWTNYWSDKVGYGEEYLYQGKYDNSYKTAAYVYDNQYNAAPIFNGRKVYTENYSIAYYVQKYNSYVNSLGIRTKEARLMSVQELFSAINNSYSNEGKGFLYSSSYWLGSAAYSGNAWYVLYKQRADFNISYYYDKGMGVRPLLVISKTDI